MKSLYPDYLTSLGILSGLAHDPNVVATLIPEEVRMESGFYRLMQEEARQSVEAEVEAKVAEIQAKAEAEASARVEAETRQRVTRENAIESILDVLDVRFQLTLMQLFKAQLEQIDDLQQLRQLHREAASAPSLEAFTETLVQNGNN